MIGVIGGGVIATPTERIPLDTANVLHATGLATLAITYGLSSVWLMPGVRLGGNHARPGFWKPTPLFGDPEHWRMWLVARDDASPYYAAIRPRSYHEDIVIHDHIDTEWMLHGDDPLQVARRIAAYERLIGVSASYTLGQTGLAALKRTCATPDRREWLKALSESAYRDTPWPSVPALQYVNRHVRDYAYVHVFDKSFAFGAACKHAFGSGDPVYLSDVDVDMTISVCQGKAYGLWRVRAWHADYDRNLPSPLGSEYEADGDWLYTPQIALAALHGYKIKILEGYHWPRRHTIFNDWVDRIWMGRKQAKAHAHEGHYAPIEAMLKASFNRAYPLFKHPLEEGRKLQWYHNPGWHGTIMSNHYLRMMLSLHNLVRRPDCEYLAVNIDSVALASDAPALPGIVTGDERLGSYKHEATFGGEYARRIIEAAREGGSPYKMMRAIDAELEDAHAVLRETTSE